MFLWYDYAILVALLTVSTFIGIYFGCFGTKQTTTYEYISGGKSMKIVPIALSVTISHFSAISLVAVPADVYKYGAFYWLSCLSTFLVVIITIYLYYPVLFKEDVCSVYEYLERRFDHRTGLLCSGMYIFFENLCLPVAVYTPALALSAVTGVKVYVITSIICGICIFYTAIGGLRTVIWTDLLQFAVVMSSFLMVCGFGINSAGGILSVWNTAVDGQRLDIFDFDINPTKKDTFWALSVGLTVRYLYYLSFSQSSVQKYLSLPSSQDRKWSMWIFGVCLCTVNTLAVFLGLIMYAIYAHCDPVMDKKVRKSDEMMPYFVATAAESITGISGIFISGLISASISSLSSSLNSLSFVIYKDFVSKFLKKDVEEKTNIFILKVIVVVQGIVCGILTMIIPYLGEILPLAVGVTGMIDGPSLGLVTLGALFPVAKSKGAFYGTLLGTMFTAVIYFPSMYYMYEKTVTYPTKPLSVAECNTTNTLSVLSESDNYTFYNTTLKSDNFDQGQPLFLFRISSNYYCLIGTVVTIIFGLIISFITGFKTSNSSNNDKVECADDPLLNTRKTTNRSLFDCLRQVQ